MFHIFGRDEKDEEWKLRLSGYPESMVKTHLTSWAVARRYKFMFMIEYDIIKVPSWLPYNIIWGESILCRELQDLLDLVDDPDDDPDRDAA